MFHGSVQAALWLSRFARIFFVNLYTVSHDLWRLQSTWSRLAMWNMRCFCAWGLLLSWVLRIPQSRVLGRCRWVLQAMDKQSLSWPVATSVSRVTVWFRELKRMSLIVNAANSLVHIDGYSPRDKHATATWDVTVGGSMLSQWYHCHAWDSGQNRLQAWWRHW
jgi:hypothetical protein